MQFGMNVQVSGDGSSATKFLQTVARAGVKAVRLVGHPSDVELLVAKAFEAEVLGLKVVVSPIAVTPATATEALLALTGGPKPWLDVYSEIAARLPLKSTLGVVLPEGLHFITRVSQKPGAIGLRREQVRFILDQLINTIKTVGQKAVMPARLDDVQGKVYDGLLFDAMEIDGMLSQAAAETLSAEAIETAMEGRPFWFGRAGMIGGYIMPAQQSRFLRQMETLNTHAQYAFLWSEEGVSQWAWSIDGDMVLDLMPDLMHGQPVIKPTGNPARAHWKAQQRIR